MKRKRYCSPVVNVFNEHLTDTLLSGSNEGTIVIPGEQIDPGGAGARWTESWDDSDEEDDSGWDNL